MDYSCYCDSFEGYVCNHCQPVTFSEGCGECTRFTPCDNPRAGCHVHVTPPSISIEETPPCCFTPALCDGPHADCYDALRAEEAVRMEAEAVGIADAVARLHDEAEHVCDAPHPYCSRDGHTDSFTAPDQDR